MLPGTFIAACHAYCSDAVMKPSVSTRSTALFWGRAHFQTTTGIAHYLDMHDLGTRAFEADSFYYDRAIDLIKRERGKGALFLYVYTVANHFPWDKRLRPELTPDWRDLATRLTWKSTFGVRRCPRRNIRHS